MGLFDETGSCYVNLAGLELRDLSASASQVLDVKVYATTPSFCTFIFIFKARNLTQGDLLLVGAYY